MGATYHISGITWQQGHKSPLHSRHTQADDNCDSEANHCSKLPDRCRRRCDNPWKCPAHPDMLVPTSVLVLLSVLLHLLQDRIFEFPQYEIGQLLIDSVVTAPWPRQPRSWSKNRLGKITCKPAHASHGIHHEVCTTWEPSTSVLAKLDVPLLVSSVVAHCAQDRLPRESLLHALEVIVEWETCGGGDRKHWEALRRA